MKDTDEPCSPISAGIGIRIVTNHSAGTEVGYWANGNFARGIIVSYDEKFNDYWVNYYPTGEHAYKSPFRVAAADIWLTRG